MTGLILVLAGCAPGAQRFRDGDLRPSANPGQVIAIERAFARMAREKGTWTAFRHYATKDALWPTPALVNVEQSLKGTPDPAQPILWGPDAAWSSCDGSFAVTTGEAAFPTGRKSRFLTVWQRQQDGEYRWVLDQGFDSPGGAIDPDTISARVAECPPRVRGARPDIRVRRGEAWGSGVSNDGTLAWTTEIAADCTRTATVRMAGVGGMEEVFRKTAPPPAAPAGQSAPRCG
ncbi:MAG: hypothetical protein LC648_01695 [Novosphingobium sp.]|nr:hypothetical protein [Novosphingobium sp.]